MSQLLSQVLKPIVRKNVIRHNNKMVRLFSYMPMYPYVLIDRIVNGQVSSDGQFVRKMVANTEKEIVIMNKELTNEIRDAMNIGYNYKTDRLKVYEYSNRHLEIRRVYFDPPYHKVRPKEVILPDLPRGSQIQNAAMPSCQREEDLNNHEDIVVVVKLAGSQLKVYRPASKVDQWTDVETIHEYMSPFSSLMFSKKDQKFYTTTPGGKYLCSFDLNFKEKDKPELVSLWPNLRLWNNVADLFPLTMIDHLVESPSGEQFLIKWYYGDDMKYSSAVKFEHKTKRFMVFKVEGQAPVKNGKNLCYTENIGDLCIFLGRDEAFCLQASSSPGLKPNCIYFVGYNYGIFDINTQICTLFTTEDGPLRSNGFPYWPHPLYITSN